MKIFKELSSSLEKVKKNIQNSVDSERIQIMDISTLKFDKEFKELFSQEPEKVDRIYRDIQINGFDKSQPLIITKDGRIIDGNSRYLAATKAGIQFIPVVVKQFNSKDEALKYELHLQLDRRNLSDAEIMKMFQKLEAMKAEAKAQGNSTEEYSDVEMSKILNKSPRQVQKLREISKKADTKTIDKVTSGELSINQAHSSIKEKKEAAKPTSTFVNSSEFIKGVRFALVEIASGKTVDEILAALQVR